MTCAPQNPVVIAVTGGIACGKSEVGKLLEKMGFMVCDADYVAHDLMKKGTPVYREVVNYFGARILSEDGTISRPRLGKEVFGNPDQLKALNRMVHPAIRSVLKMKIEESRQKKQSLATLVPLLFESGMNTLKWDAIVCVSSTEEKVVERLESRGLGREESRQRIGSQFPLGEKEQRSAYVIHNNGSLEELEQSTRETVQGIMTEGVL